MEVAQLLGLQGLGNTKCAGMMVASGTGAMALLVSSSSLWQLAFKGPPWLTLLCCLAQQVLKGPHSLESFSIGQLLVLVCKDRGYRDGSIPCVTQQYHLASTAACLSSKGIPRCSFLPHIPSGHLPSVNSRLHPGIAL